MIKFKLFPFITNREIFSILVSLFVSVSFFVLILGLSEAHGATQSHSGINLKRILFQSLNLFFIGCGIIYVAGPSCVDFFKEQKEQYLEVYHATKREKQKSLDKLHQSQAKLAQLEKDFAKELEKAQMASQKHHNKLLKETEEDIQNMEKDLKQTIQLELYLAYRKLQNKLVEEMSKQSQKQTPEALNSKTQEKIEEHFISKVDTVSL